ncbi:NAD(P)-dependent dehydrogenase (short-subunit alcohol dehydrogenase family) [Pullulanibacillus pueri]|uniref:Putative oxidoreductase n=1 Tax=Pullulanibacillus pueri TaxID=1437324 RepID=A0A8J2ZTU1_9BACL|nr:glucose 1-dehydrogenase [Pullulanibacillus pueri]MBM7680302.1 NAD(P)-dependent dehydrogenase (short-subunit alcohol dehydrogenase family) [Pullulanibacillus pueri]GGH75756.1 putative oxidoreductase [Pullulanibacillus pueri]
MSVFNKTVIVTGAANGIGRGVATLYAQKGAKVVLADIDEKAGNTAVKAIQEQNGKACFIQTDVRSETDIRTLMATAKAQYGTIDILINNAGKGLFKPLNEVTLEEWEDVIHTNLRSVFLGSREAAKYMRENDQGGAIVNIASTRAIMSEPHSEGYAATKAGIVGLTHALAASLSEDRITVNAISPGWIETGDYSKLLPSDHEQHFSKRVGKPEDIARACLYLTDNDFVTGINLVVDGGMTRKMIYEE